MRTCAFIISFAAITRIHAEDSVEEEEGVVAEEESSKTDLQA